MSFLYDLEILLTLQIPNYIFIVSQALLRIVNFISNTLSLPTNLIYTLD